MRHRTVMRIIELAAACVAITLGLALAWVGIGALAGSGQSGAYEPHLEGRLIVGGIFLALALVSIGGGISAMRRDRTK